MFRGLLVARVSDVSTGVCVCISRQTFMEYNLAFKKKEMWIEMYISSFITEAYYHCNRGLENALVT